MSVTKRLLRDGEGPIYIQSSVISRGYQLDPFNDLFGFLIIVFLSPTFVRIAVFFDILVISGVVILREINNMGGMFDAVMTSILKCVRILPCVLVMSVLVNLLLPLQSGLMEYISGLEVLACSSPEIQRF